MNNNLSTTDYKMQYSTSSVLNETAEYLEKTPQRQHSKAHVGFVLLFLGVSLSSTGATLDSRNLILNSTTLECQSSLLEEKEHSEVLIEFVSKLIENSKDIDPRIVDVINEDFWELI